MINLDTFEATKQHAINDDTTVEDKVSHDSSIILKNSFFLYQP